MCVTILITHLIVLLTINLIDQIFTIRIIKIKKKIIVKVIICIKCLAILHTKKIDLFELTEIVVANKRSRNLIKFTRFWLNQNSD